MKLSPDSATPHRRNDSASAAGDTERLNLALAAARLGDFSWDVKTDLAQACLVAVTGYG